MKGNIENSVAPVGLKPTTSCFLGKHTTTVPREAGSVSDRSGFLPMHGRAARRPLPKWAGPG